MYETHFQFRSRPFMPTPQTASYFPAAAIEAARQGLVRAIERCEGPGLITGPPGTGKTLLCRVLAEHFQTELAVAMLAGGRLKSCQALLQAISYELDLPYQGIREGELRLALVDFLEPRDDGPRGLLLIVDEAHTLPWKLLDEVRLITNLVRDGQPRVRVVLAGGPELEERFASPKMGSFSQRVAARSYLEPLESVETAEYVKAQLTLAGGDAAQVVDEPALQSVYRATDGIPRLINQVCDHALVLACLAGLRRLASEVIDEAWADLQQLPTPWPVSGERGSGSTVVEFGSLRDDDADAAADAIPLSAHDALAPEGILPLDPEARLDAISGQLEAIDRHEGPGGAGTEVELDFPEYCDPFGERFAEEEIVVDRYAADVEIFADVPRVSCWEGRQLGAELAQAELTEPWGTVFDDRLADPPADEVVRGDAWTFDAASDPVLPEEPAEGEDESATGKTGAGQACGAEEASPVRPASLVGLSGRASDRDLIVIEDDRRVPAALSAPQRTGQFRELFAKLRRG